MRILGIAIVTAACGYQPGSFVWGMKHFTGESSTVGCLDISVARSLDSDVGPVLVFDFGNRCMRPAVVDFQHARVEGVTADGQRVPLAPYDPDADITEQMIDARLGGHEAIAYASETRLVDVCVELASIAHAPGESWRCFARGTVTP